MNPTHSLQSSEEEMETLDGTESSSASESDETSDDESTANTNIHESEKDAVKLEKQIKYDIDAQQITIEEILERMSSYGQVRKDKLYESNEHKDAAISDTISIESQSILVAKLLTVTEVQTDLLMCEVYTEPVPKEKKSKKKHGADIGVNTVSETSELSQSEKTKPSLLTSDTTKESASAIVNTDPVRVSSYFETTTATQTSLTSKYTDEMVPKVETIARNMGMVTDSEYVRDMKDAAVNTLYVRITTAVVTVNVGIQSEYDEKDTREVSVGATVRTLEASVNTDEEQVNVVRIARRTIDIGISTEEKESYDARVGTEIRTCTASTNTVDDRALTREMGIGTYLPTSNAASMTGPELLSIQNSTSNASTNTEEKRGRDAQVGTDRTRCGSIGVNTEQVFSRHVDTMTDTNTAKSVAINTVEIVKSTRDKIVGTSIRMANKEVETRVETRSTYASTPHVRRLDVETNTDAQEEKFTRSISIGTSITTSSVGIKRIPVDSIKRRSPTPIESNSDSEDEKKRPVGKRVRFATSDSDNEEFSRSPKRGSHFDITPKLVSNKTNSKWKTDDYEIASSLESRAISPGKYDLTQHRTNSPTRLDNRVSSPVIIQSTQPPLEIDTRFSSPTPRYSTTSPHNSPTRISRQTDVHTTSPTKISIIIGDDVINITPTCNTLPTKQLKTPTKAPELRQDSSPTMLQTEVLYKSPRTPDHEWSSDFVMIKRRKTASNSGKDNRDFVWYLKNKPIIFDTSSKKQ
jgi:hypothetical protein